MQNNFILFKTCENRLEADLLKAYLESEGIAVIIKSDDAGGMIPSLSLLNGVDLFISQTDLPKAQEILNL